MNIFLSRIKRVVFLLLLTTTSHVWAAKPLQKVVFLASKQGLVKKKVGGAELFLEPSKPTITIKNYDKLYPELFMPFDLLSKEAEKMPDYASFIPSRNTIKGGHFEGVLRRMGVRIVN